jgi:hypothetical protein
MSRFALPSLPWSVLSTGPYTKHFSTQHKQFGWVGLLTALVVYISVGMAYYHVRSSDTYVEQYEISSIDELCDERNTQHCTPGFFKFQGNVQPVLAQSETDAISLPFYTVGNAMQMQLLAPNVSISFFSDGCPYSNTLSMPYHMALHHQTRLKIEMSCNGQFQLQVDNATNVAALSVAPYQCAFSASDATTISVRAVVRDGDPDSFLFYGMSVTPKYSFVAIEEKVSGSISATFLAATFDNSNLATTGLGPGPDPGTGPVPVTATATAQKLQLQGSYRCSQSHHVSGSSILSNYIAFWSPYFALVTILINFTLRKCFTHSRRRLAMNEDYNVPFDVDDNARRLINSQNT